MPDSLLESARPDVLIVNTTGELRDWYAVATVCFIGKSLTATGGQNPAEPVLVNRPVVFGPHMENFSALVRQFLAVGGAVQVQDEADLTREIGVLLADSVRGEALVAKARTVLQVHLGANRRTADLLLA
jgi:3-deoxy-D-manno-octulosonic-acid transferase